MSAITEAADTLSRFLKEPVVTDAFTALRNDAYREFLSAQTDEDRRQAHATAKAVDKLETAFRAVVDAGERERTEQEKAERSLSAR